MDIGPASMQSSSPPTALLASAGKAIYSQQMLRAVQLGDLEYADAINREITQIRDSGALGRSSKLRDLFDYLVERSRTGMPPKEIEIAQDVFGRAADENDDGAGRVYIHRLRKRLEEIYKQRSDAATRIALPLGEYRLVAELGVLDAPTADDPTEAVPDQQPRRWRHFALGALAGAVFALAVVAALVPSRGPGWFDAAQARRSPVWAPLLSNQRNLIVAEGDYYLFAETDGRGGTSRLIRDMRITSRADLNAYLLSNPEEAKRYADAGLGYVPRTVPRAQLYLSPILLEADNVRTLPASQISDSALLSQNIVYLGLTSGLGPLRPPVAAGSRFALSKQADVIRDRRTGRDYRSAPAQADSASPQRHYGLVSLFPGKEGNRFIVLAGTSEMGLIGLVETLADPKRLEELASAIEESAAIEALYEIDSQGAGILAARLITLSRRDQARIWQPGV